MEICRGDRNARHDEIVTYGLDCDLCTALKSIAELEAKVEALEKEIEDLEA